MTTTTTATTSRTWILARAAASPHARLCRRTLRSRSCRPSTVTVIARATGRVLRRRSTSPAREGTTATGRRIRRRRRTPNGTASACRLHLRRRRVTTTRTTRKPAVIRPPLRQPNCRAFLMSSNKNKKNVHFAFSVRVPAATYQHYAPLFFFLLFYIQLEGTIVTILTIFNNHINYCNYK